MGCHFIFLQVKAVDSTELDLALVHKKTPKIIHFRSLGLSVCYVKALFNLKYQNEKRITILMS